MKSGIGEFLSILRKSKGLTQQEVADALGVSNKTVSSWETGASCPDIGMLPAIAELFGVTCDELLRGAQPYAATTRVNKRYHSRSGIVRAAGNGGQQRLEHKKAPACCERRYRRQKPPFFPMSNLVRTAGFKSAVGRYTRRTVARNSFLPPAPAP